jgi:hypothetical protein
MRAELQAAGAKQQLGVGFKSTHTQNLVGLHCFVW